MRYNSSDSARNGKFHETERCIVQNIGAFRGQYKRQKCV